jgi:hypothetical protein
MPTEVKNEIGIEEVRKALSDALPHWRVTPTSESTLRVLHDPVIWSVVRLSWSGGKTNFYVRPGGFLLVALFNALYTVPKIRRILAKALG